MRLARRPPAVTTLAFMYMGGSAIGLLGVVFPLSDHTPVELNASIELSAIAVGAALWLAGTKAPAWLLHALAAGATCIVSVLIANAATGTGIMLAAFSYVWIAIWAALFGSRLAVVLHASLISLAFGAALLVNDIPNMLPCWLIVSATVGIASAALNHQSLLQRALAVTDPLTGLVNRNGLLQAAERELAITGRTGRPLTVAVIDLDGFKAINDRDGHVAGDRVLADLAARWTATLRGADVLARAGGDEFVLLLPDTEEAAAVTLLDRLHEVSDIEWSAGTAVLAPDDDFDACMARADRALYAAKADRSGPPGKRPTASAEVATVEA